MSYFEYAKFLLYKNVSEEKHESEESHFCLLKLQVISTESISVPENSIFWIGQQTDSFMLIKIIIHGNNWIKLFLPIVFSSFEIGNIKLSSRKTIEQKFSFLNTRMGVFIDPVNFICPRI